MNGRRRLLVRTYLWGSGLLAALLIVAFIADFPFNPFNPFRSSRKTRIAARPFDIQISNDWSLVPSYYGMSFGHRYEEQQIPPALPPLSYIPPPATQETDPLPPGAHAYIDPRASVFSYAIPSSPEKRTGANFLGFGYDAFTQGSSFDWSIHFPLQLITFLLVPHLVLLYGIIRRKPRKRAGLCPACRYDLRAHASGQNCPECGTPIR